MIPALTVAAVLSAAAGGAAVPAQDVAAPTSKRSYVARIVQATAARSAPDAAARVVGRVHANAPWNAGPMQLMIDAVARGSDGGVWYRVLLAKKPNGSYGWIASDFAQAYENRWRIEIDVSARRMTILHSGRTVRSTRTVVGARATPTPTGRFAIREVVRQPDPGGFSGPWIFHLNANSQQLRSFDGGDGTIGIHGRGPASLGDPLGSARSHGCVRAPNAVVRYMAARIVAGTPVRITR
jgi:lipoprotein-anchoring transpeptidase ErfK/SrfK